jgi:TPR repeat protein
LSAAQGNPNAMYNLGLMYVDGDGVEQDYEKAAEWLEKAAKGDLAPAQYDLAALYKEGIGVKQSLSTAAFWLQKAAEAGMTNAELELGIALYLGKGVEKNEKLGFEMFRRSAEKGNPVAQNRLAHAYAAGLGTEHDPVEAAKWHMLSREFGVSDFRLDKLLSGLSPDVRSKAQQSAELWQKSTDALLQ